MSLATKILQFSFLTLAVATAAVVTTPLATNAIAQSTSTDTNITAPSSNTTVVLDEASQLEIMTRVLSLTEQRAPDQISFKELMSLVPGWNGTELDKYYSRTAEIEKMLNEDLNMELEEAGTIGNFLASEKKISNSQSNVQEFIAPEETTQSSTRTRIYSIGGLKSNSGTIGGSRL